MIGHGMEVGVVDSAVIAFPYARLDAERARVIEAARKAFIETQAQVLHESRIEPDGCEFHANLAALTACLEAAGVQRPEGANRWWAGEYYGWNHHYGIPTSRLLGFDEFRESLRVNLPAELPADLVDLAARPGYHYGGLYRAEPDLEAMAAQEADSMVKTANPKLRRGSKAFRVALESVRGEARRRAAYLAKADLEGQYAYALRTGGRAAKDASQIQARAERLREVVWHAEALWGAIPEVAKALGVVSGVMEVAWKVRAAGNAEARRLRGTAARIGVSLGEGQVKEGAQCVDPDLAVSCSKCGAEFLCADAPHDEMGPSCPACGSLKVEERADA